MRPTHARGKQSGRSLVEAKADCVTERDIASCLCYITARFAVFVLYLRSSTFDVTRNRGTTLYIITKHSSALYIGMAKVLPIIDALGYDGQNSSFSSSPPPSR